VRPLVVVGRGELVEQGLQVGDGGGLVGLGAQPVLRRLGEPLHLAAGRGVVNTIVLSVRVDAGVPWAATAARKVSRAIGPVTRGQADTCRAEREWSSSQVRISASVASASR
jgi:hypothetical protein